MFYYEVPWLYQDFKSEDLFLKSILSSRSENTGPDTRGHIKSSQMRNEKLLQLQTLFLHSETGIIFLVFRSQVHQYF